MFLRTDRSKLCKSELVLEKKTLVNMKELCEDSDEERTVEKAIKERTEIIERIERLKEYIKKQDKKKTVTTCSKENRLGEEWNDQRNYRAREAGVPHSAAWRKWKGRRRATLFR